MKDKKVQDAQDYIRKIAVPGSYLCSIADLIDDLYSLAMVRNGSDKNQKLDHAEDEKIAAWINSENEKIAAKTLQKRAELWAANGSKRL